MKKKMVHSRSLAAACCAAGILLSALQGCGKPGTAGMPPQSGGPPEAAFITVAPEKIAVTDELPGRTSAFLVAEVRPQITGIIKKRLFDEGSDVKAGDVLYEIDPALYKAAHDRAAAELSRANAHITSVKSKLDRYRTLIEAKAISSQEFDDARADFEKAQADIEACRAAAETARINLEYTKVTAPISGRIGKSNVTVGALVMANQPSPLATIQQLDPIYVDLTQSSANFLRLRQNISGGFIRSNGPKGAKASLSFEDGSPYPHQGELEFRDVTIDPDTGSFILRLVFPNPDFTLLPGMYVRAVLEEGTVENAILAPHQSVSRDVNGNPMAMVIGGSDKAEARILKIDQSIGGRWLVKEGLKPGDRLIVEGFQKIRPGAPVKPVPFSNEAAALPPKPDAQAQTKQ